MPGPLPPALQGPLQLGWDSDDYLQEMPYPDLDDPEREVYHILDGQSQGWNEIANPNTIYDTFLVYPGDHRDKSPLVTEIQSSGTEAKPKWLMYYDPLNPNDHDTHPVDMDEADRAIIGQLTHGRSANDTHAAHWYVDRLTLRGNSFANRLREESHWVIWNKMLVEEGENAGFYVFGPADCWLQQSVLRNPILIEETDVIAMYIGGGSSRVYLVNNEIYNYVDGWEQGPDSDKNCAIVGNDFYITRDIFADGLGNLDIRGTFAAAEDGIDIKGASNPPNILIVENNVFWGFKQTDHLAGGSGGSGAGINAGAGAFQSDDSFVHRNIFFNIDTYGITHGVNHDRWEITHNVFYNVDDGELSVLEGNTGDGILRAANTIIGSSIWGVASTLTERNVWDCNCIMTSRPLSGSPGWENSNELSRNYYYDMKEPLSPEEEAAGAIEFDSTDDAKCSPLTFTIRQWSDPTEMTIPNVLPTPDSPHYACFQEYVIPHP